MEGNHDKDSYICIMKTKQIKTADKKTLRAQILMSTLASFRIEGIHITKEAASETLKKVELSLGR